MDRGLDKVGGAIGHTNSVTAGTTSGITFDAQGHITGTTALTGSDLPEATTTALGGVSVPTTSGLSVTAAGELGIANTVTPATTAGITYNADGLITGSVALSGTDLPVATSTSVGGISVPATSGLEVDVAGNINIQQAVLPLDRTPKLPSTTKELSPAEPFLQMPIFQTSALQRLLPEQLEQH